MDYPQMVKRSVEEEDRRLSLIVIELANAVFGFFYEGDEERAGTIALSLPKTNTSPSVSSIVIGVRNATAARLLAEFLAQRYLKMAFASVFTHQENDFTTNQRLLKLAQGIETKGKET